MDSLSLLEKLPEHVFGRICSFFVFDETLVALFATNKEIRKLLLFSAPSIPIPRSVITDNNLYNTLRDSRLIRASGLVYLNQDQLEGPMNREPDARMIEVRGTRGRTPRSISRILECIDLTKITVLKLDTLSGNLVDFESQVVTLPNLKVLGITGDVGVHGDVLERFTKLTELTVLGYEEDNDFTLPNRLRKLTLSMRKFFPGLTLPKQLIELDLTMEPVGLFENDIVPAPPNQEEQEELRLVIPNSCLKTLRLNFFSRNVWRPNSVELETDPSILTSLYLIGASYHENLIISSPRLEVLEYSFNGAVLREVAFTGFMGLIQNMSHLHTLIMDKLECHQFDPAGFAVFFTNLHALRVLSLTQEIFGLRGRETVRNMFTQLARNLNPHVEIEIIMMSDQYNFQPIANRVIRISRIPFDCILNYSGFTRLEELEVNAKSDLWRKFVKEGTFVLPPRLRKLTVNLVRATNYDIENSALFAKAVFGKHPLVVEIVIWPRLFINLNVVDKIRQTLKPFYVNISESRIRCTRARWCFVHNQRLDRRTLAYI